MPHTPARRRILVALGSTALLGGCGFALRQTPPLPFRRIALTGFAVTSPLAGSLRQRLAAAAQVVDAPGQAEAAMSQITSPSLMPKKAVSPAAEPLPPERQTRVKSAKRARQRRLNIGAPLCEGQSSLAPAPRVCRIARCPRLKA